MKKLSRSQWIMKMAVAINRAYGYNSILKSDGTDIELAEAVFEELKRYIYYRPEDKFTSRKFESWKDKRR